MRVVLDGVNGRQLVLDALEGASDDLRYSAELVLPEGRVSIRVWEYHSGLAAFVRELADSWPGFEGVKAYATTEGELELSCRHDGRGTVECRARLSQPWPQEWSMEAVLDFGAGAHLDRLASEIETFFA